MPGFGPEVAAACLLLVATRAWLGDRLAGPRRDWLVAAASVVVVASWQLAGVVVTLLLAGLTWLATRRSRSGLARLPTGIVILVLLAPLAVFKYWPWFAPHLGETWRPRTAWVVPLGLSFTVFRLIGALMDSRALRLTPAAPRLFLLATFFPTFPSGPITTLQSLRDLDNDDLRGALVEGGRRIVRGLARKVLLADPLHAFVVGPWLRPGVAQLEPYQCLVLPVLLGFYVYWDFAGYSDVAIGVARLVGYRVPENFDRPYLSRNLVEFWRRWHITLSEWIRTRLMMKMAGRRAGPWRLRGATLASMAICGLWHGAGTGYLAWGLWHGLGLIAVHALRDFRPRLEDAPARVPSELSAVAATATTFAFVSVGWVFFFFSPGDAILLVSGALSWRGGAGAASLVPLLTIGTLVVAYLGQGAARAVWARLPGVIRRVATAILLGLLTYALFLASGQPREFLYVQF